MHEFRRVNCARRYSELQQRKKGRKLSHVNEGKKREYRETRFDSLALRAFTPFVSIVASTLQTLSLSLVGEPPLRDPLRFIARKFMAGKLLRLAKHTVA